MIQQSHFGVYVWRKWNHYLRGICTLVFTAALFIIAKIWEQPKYLSMDECIKCNTYTYTHTHTHIHTRARARGIFSLKKGNSAISDMNEPGGYAKWNKPDTEKQILHDPLTCGIELTETAEWWLPRAGVGEWGDVGPRVQTFKCKLEI